MPLLGIRPIDVRRTPDVFHSPQNRMVAVRLDDDAPCRILLPAAMVIAEASSQNILPKPHPLPLLAVVELDE
ncbi:MAG: hypothetical protein ACK55Z_33185, partial [bacterium]